MDHEHVLYAAKEDWNEPRSRISMIGVLLLFAALSAGAAAYQLYIFAILTGLSCIGITIIYIIRSYRGYTHHIIITNNYIETMRNGECLNRSYFREARSITIYYDGYAITPAEGEPLTSGPVLWFNGKAAIKVLQAVCPSILIDKTLGSVNPD